MKNRKQLFLTILIIAIAFTSFGQVNFRCDLPSILTAPPAIPCASNFSDYTFNQPLIYNINIHVFKRTMGSGIYDNVTLADAQGLVSSVNWFYSNIAPNPSIPANPPASPTPPNSNVSFNLKSFYVHTDDDAFTANKYLDVGFRNKLHNVYAVNKYREFNIFFIADPLHIGGGEALSGFIITSQNGLGSGFWSFFAHIGHELGHAIGGLGHPELTSPGFVPPDVYEPIANPPGALTGPCGQAGITNNIMSNQNYQCKEYLSPLQIATFSLTASINDGINATGNNSNYNSRGFTDLCDYDVTKSVVVSNDETWVQSRNIRGNLIVMPSVHLTIKCKVNMTSNARVIVKLGGKLTLDGGTFTNFCEDMWHGVFVEGNVTNPQTLDANSMPLHQGMIEVINSGRIEHAKTAITTLFASSPSGGGIIQCTSAQFQDNQQDIYMGPYVYIDPSKPNKKIANTSFFKNTSFLSALNLRGGNTKLRNFNLYQVRDVLISGCSFGTFSGTEAIKSVDASFIINDYCQNPPSCSSVIRTYFQSTCDYFVHSSNSVNFYPSSIDHSIVSQSFKKTAFYLSGANYSSVVNNDFTMGNYTIYSTPIPQTGVYFDNSMGFIVQNNKIFSFSGTPNPPIGIIINNSGPYANSVYNNTLTGLYQGIWAQNQNVDFSTGTGLKMNCNDFTNCNYNIGVQKAGRNLLFPNNTGVAFTQGLANTLNDQDNVRNTYGTPSCNSNAENKFYVNTGNSLNITHGSFNNFGSFTVNQLHPIPQTSSSCSNLMEVTDIIGNTPSNPNKSSYCPTAYPPSFSNLMLSSEATLQRQTIASLTNTLTLKVDGGNTEELLEAINSGTISNGNIKNMLVAVGPYLSDQVMLAYYNTNPPYGHDKIIHEINAPVSPVVFQKILSLNLPSGVLQSIQNNQNQNTLSTRRLLEAELSFAKTDLGLILNEKIRRFLNDSTINPSDSIDEILRTREIPNSDLLEIKASVAFRNYDKAYEQLILLDEGERTPSEFGKLYSLILRLAVDPEFQAVLALDDDKKEQLILWATSYDPMLEGEAKAILLGVYNYYIEEEKLTPDQNTGARFSNNKESEQPQTIYLNSSVKVFPNPAHNELFIEMENNNATTIEIRDVTGKLLKTQEIESKGVVNVESLENGIYFINLVSESKLINSKKIVILK